MKTYFNNIAGIPEIIEEIKKVTGFLWEKGWAERNAGNLSYNITDIAQEYIEFLDFETPVKSGKPFPNLDNNLLLVTGTGTRMRDVFKNPYNNICILHIVENGTAYRQFQKPESGIKILPTSELSSHLAIHEMLVANNREEKVIIHTHPNNLIALTHIREFCDEDRINNMLWSIQPETRVFIHEGIGFVHYLQTGSDDLADATIGKLKKHRVALWEKHGCLAIGKNPAEAFDLIDIAEKSADIFFICKSAGYKAEGISKKNLDELQQAFNIE